MAFKISREFLKFLDQEWSDTRSVGSGRLYRFKREPLRIAQ